MARISNIDIILRNVMDEVSLGRPFHNFILNRIHFDLSDNVEGIAHWSSKDPFCITLNSHWVMATTNDDLHKALTHEVNMIVSHCEHNNQYNDQTDTAINDALYRPTDDIMLQNAIDDIRRYLHQAIDDILRNLHANGHARISTHMLRVLYEEARRNSSNNYAYADNGDSYLFADIKSFIDKLEE